MKITQTGGAITTEIGLWQRIEHLDIIQANIFGSIPTEIGKLSMLRELCEESYIVKVFEIISHFA